jgi:hypothetical protein
MSDHRTRDGQPPCCPQCGMALEAHFELFDHIPMCKAAALEAKFNEQRRTILTERFFPAKEEDYGASGTQR